MLSGPAISSQLPRNTPNLPTTNAGETGDSHRGRQNMDDVSSRDDVPTPRRSTQRLLNHGSTGGGSSNVTPRPRGPAQWPDQWNNDVWFEAMQTRHRPNDNEYRRRGDERHFVHYVPPGYSDAVHFRSNYHRYPVDQFTAYSLSLIHI